MEEEIKKKGGRKFLGQEKRKVKEKRRTIGVSEIGKQNEGRRRKKKKNLEKRMTVDRENLINIEENRQKKIGEKKISSKLKYINKNKIQKIK